MRCYVARAAKKAGLQKYEWWLSVEAMFALWMVGRYLNDGLGTEPPTPEEALRDMQILARVKQYRQLDNVIAIINKVDEARRNHENPVRDEEG
jgi:hypothetical protein